MSPRRFLDWSEFRTKEWFARAKTLASEKRFFHWELEFPEAFQGENRGFDVVMGNPPYDELSEEAWGRKIDEMPYFQETKHLIPALGYRVNIYRLFISQALELTRHSGWHGFIVPLSLLADQFTLSLRRYLLEMVKFRLIEQFPQKDDSHDRVFLDAKLSTCLYIVQREQPKENNVYVRTHPGREILSSSSSYTTSQSNFFKFDRENLSIPGLAQSSWDLILKLATSKDFIPFGNIAKALPGELMINHQFDPYISDGKNGEELSGDLTSVCINSLSQNKVNRSTSIERNIFLIMQIAKKRSITFKEELFINDMQR